MHYRIKHIAEYIGLRIVSCIILCMPYALANRIACVACWITFHWFHFRHNETFRRIRTVFPDATDARVSAIAYGSLKNMFLNAVEMMRAHHMTPQWLNTHVEDSTRYTAYFNDIITRYGGLIFSVPHMGNWDLGAWILSTHNIKICAIAGRQRNTLIDRWINRVRKTSMMVLERGSTDILKIPKLLKSGHVLAVLPDLRSPQKDLAIPFLGGIANVSRATARFACAAHVPIVTVILRRNANGYHVMTISDPIFPDPACDKNENARAMTTKVLTLIDTAIRETPEQWFWYNKRWVLTPPLNT